MTLKSVLVLGSSGQIGSSLVSFLKGSGLVVGTFDIAENAIEDLRLISNNDLVETICKFDFTVFLAFDVGGSKYLEEHQNSSSFIINNLQIMSNTFDALSKARKPFIFASSQIFSSSIPRDSISFSSSKTRAKAPNATDRIDSLVSKLSRSWCR